MLGIAGARHILRLEGYRWIAPLSAFYPDAIQTVDLSTWNTAFPRSSIVATRKSGNTSRLFPDYLALRPTTSGGSYDWAVAEAKGTSMSLTSAASCPSEWSTQVRNVTVTVNGTELEIPRHVVIATRVNPNAKRARARRLQVRAWNRTVNTKASLSSEAAVDIAAAHLFGFFRGAYLRENAMAIAFSVHMRAASRQGKLSADIKTDAQRAADLAEEEISERSGRLRNQGNVPGSTIVELDTESGPIRIELAEPLIALSRRLRQSETIDSAAAALHDADLRLNAWEKSREPVKKERGIAVLPFGAEVHFPHGFDPRDQRR
ncbi:MAG TPA: hypothetical protein VFR24_02065 [Candidatus Angelobacter sp.]|nr:hypothetical protein [Candidatus Angelobacter sp.]